MAVPDAKVELQIAGSWVNITSAVRKTDGIRHSRGRRSEGARVDPSSIALTLSDPSGTYNSRNPRSPYFGKLGRNTPIRYSIGGAAVALALPPGEDGYSWTPHTGVLSITGDIDIRAEVAPGSWSGDWAATGWSVVGKTTSGQMSYWLVVLPNGTLSLQWSTTGSNILSETSTIAVPFAPGQRAAIRATLDVNNGTGGRTTTFYVADSISGTWVQLGAAVVTASTTSIFAGVGALKTGVLPIPGFDNSVGLRVHAVEVRNGIGGTVVANPNFGAQSPGTGAFADSTGLTWFLDSSAEITNRRIRAVGEVSEWAPRWHVSGNDVRAPITAAGLLRRLGQGQRPLKSVLTRGTPHISSVVAYWPLEDGRDSTQVASPIAGVAPLTVSGLSLAADSSFPAADALATIVASGTLKGRVPVHSPSAWTIAFHYKLPAAPSTSGTVLEWTTTGVPWRIWRVRFSATTCDVIVEDGLGATTLVGSSTNTSVQGAGWQRFIVTAIPVGPDLSVVGTFGSTTLSGASLGQINAINTVFGPSLAGAGFGQLAIFSSLDPQPDGLEVAYSGETAGTRVARLTAEEGIAAGVWGDLSTQAALGYQRPAQLLELLAECEGADGGILMEDRERIGLIYQSRETLYNRAPTLTIPYAHLAELGPPRDDDTRIRNSRAVHRANGSFGSWSLDSGAMSTQDPPAGVGLYEDDVTLNLASDDQCQPIAQWLVHLGTVDEARYPQVKLMLHKYPQYIDAVTRIDVGSVIRVTGLPSHLPPGPLDLLVEGYEEELGPLSWDLTLTCSPAEPWQVGVVEDGAFGRADTDGSQLASGATSTATSLSVAVTAGPLWTTSAPEFPFDIQVAGEVMTVTNITGSSSPQTFTVTRSVNGIAKAQLAVADVRLAQPSIAAL